MQKKNASPTAILESASQPNRGAIAAREPMNPSGQNATAGFTVVKRNGMLVPFRRDRIFMALEAAFRDTRKIGESAPLPPEIHDTIQQVTNLIVQDALERAKMGASLTVEGIQDLAEVKLMETGNHDVARDYIVYRDLHKALRQDSPRNLKVLRRDGTLVRMNPMKIASSVEQAFRASGRIEGPTPEDVIQSVNLITDRVVSEAVRLNKEGKVLDVGMIADEIEKQLMAEGFYVVAKDLIISRALRSVGQGVEVASAELSSERVRARGRIFPVEMANGATGEISEGELQECVAYACRGLENLVSADEVIQASIANFYSGMKAREADQSNIMAARAKVEREPAYSYVAARLLLDVIYREVMMKSARDKGLIKAHQKGFVSYVQRGVELGRLDPDLLTFDLERLGKSLDLSRDLQFTYLGLQTLYDRYFIHEEGRRLETPQFFWMRVAMGLCRREGKQKNDRAVEFYDIISRFLYTPGTPTLFNAGTVHSQCSSCFLLTVSDDLSHIFKTISDNAQLSKWAGGIGDDWTNVRATGARIKGTNGLSQGVIPFLKVANDTAVAVNQCFAPETLIYTSQGIKPIQDISVGDLVLGTSGIYRSVIDTYVYNQQDAMVSLDLKHTIDPIHVTAGHPFYAIQNVPMEQSVARTMNWLQKGKIRSEWVEAGQLRRGDYIAQTIPQEVVPVADVGVEDAHLYGILLGDGHASKHGMQWDVSGNPREDEHLEFVRSYLTSRGIHFWETGRGENYLQIHWASGRGAVRDGTTGRIVGSGPQTLPFEYGDLYDAKGCKRIAPRLAHLPRPQTLALIQGLLETDGNVSRNKEITFCNTSRELVEGLRYQCLRLGIPTASHKRTRKHNHVGKRSDGSVASFNCETTSYDVRIPAVAEIAECMRCQPISKHNWLIHGNHLFTRLKNSTPKQPTAFVCDLKVEDDESYMTTAGLAHNGGKRKGAVCAYLETWHLDIEDFLELRKNTGDERRRTHDMNTANWIPDLFLKRVEQGGKWTLFSPSDVPDLHHIYGQEFEKQYVQYEQMAKEGKIKLYKEIEAELLWRKMLGMLFETGHPWITFKDPSNIRSPQDHAGVVHSSNLCTEILLNTSEDETAVCNLGSINLAALTTERGLNEGLVEKTVRTAIRMLDNVIDVNFYPTKESENANRRHRPIGLGIMGFQDALYKQSISYASHQAVEFSDVSMEMISYYAILASTELAKERGPYESYKGSKWDRGILPIDSIALLAQERGNEYLEMDATTRMDWSRVRQAVARYGMRNSNTMAIAPTATIANITGVTQSIEPAYKHLFVKSNLSGEFTVPNTFLVEVLKQLGMWDVEMLDDLKYFDGSLLEIERIPEEIRKIYLTAFEIEPEWIIECASRRQKWIDMGQSLNLYLAEPSGKKLRAMYLFAWHKGLKTTYYLRSLGATQIEKSTTDINKRALQPRWMKSESPSAKIKVDRGESAKVPVCNLEEGCEACQ